MLTVTQGLLVYQRLCQMEDLESPDGSSSGGRNIRILYLHESCNTTIENYFENISSSPLGFVNEIT